MAISKTPMKISALAKDFNLKSKDVIDIFAALGVEKKTSGTVDSDEFSAFLEHITTNKKKCQVLASSNIKKLDFFVKNITNPAIL